MDGVSHRVTFKYHPPKQVNKNAAAGNAQHLSIDSYKKLNRASRLSFWMHLHLREQDDSASLMLWIPEVFSCIHDDISDVLKEAESIGLYDKFIKKGR